MAHRTERGFTLLELLVVVAIIAIIASIAALSYFTAIDRAKQKRTVNDMRMIAAAWEARAADMNSYSVAGAAFSFPATEIAYPSLEKALTPTYTRMMPQYDGWNHEFEFGAAGKVYAIRSTGRDGKVETTVVPGETSSPDCDIIYANGSFICYPAAAQSK
jgi:general secretion pathway protein G